MKTFIEEFGKVIVTSVIASGLIVGGVALSDTGINHIKNIADNMSENVVTSELTEPKDTLELFSFNSGEYSGFQWKTTWEIPEDCEVVERGHYVSLFGRDEFKNKVSEEHADYYTVVSAPSATAFKNTDKISVRSYIIVKDKDGVEKTIEGEKIEGTYDELYKEL